MKCTVQLLSLTGEWVDAGGVTDEEPPGSISSREPGHPRQVFLFGWYDGAPGVWRSQAGVDVATPAVRTVTSTGLERLADLASGPFTLDVWVKGRQAQVRFALEARP